MDLALTRTDGALRQYHHAVTPIFDAVRPIRDEIGERYRLSPHTVRTHINHVLRKLGVHSTLAAVSLANKAQVP